jgi:hypothetical protein
VIVVSLIVSTLVLNLPWLKFTPLVVAFIIAVSEALTRKTDRKWFHRFLVPVLSLIALLASCWIVWSDDKSAREAKTGENAHLDRIEGKLGSEEATHRYLDAVNKLTQQLTAAKTGNSVEKFFSSQNERRKLRDDLRQANTKLLSSYEIRITPVRDYVIGKFDSWLREIRKRGLKIEITNGDVPAVSVGVQKTGAVREAVFESGDKILLQFYSALIVDGRLAGPLHCQMPFLPGKGQFQAGEVFAMNIGESHYTITNTRPSRFTYKEYTGKLENPIEDKEFISVLDEALDEVMAFVVEEATATK